MLETLVEAGLLTIQEMFHAIRYFTVIYEEIANEEKLLLESDRKRFLEQIQYIASRRETLAHIILYYIISLSDFRLIWEDCL
jgi:hypothetical protein